MNREKFKDEPSGKDPCDGLSRRGWHTIEGFLRSVTEQKNCNKVALWEIACEEIVVRM